MSVISPARQALRPIRVLSSAQPKLQLPKPINAAVATKRTMSSAEQTPTFNYPERQPSSEERALVDDVLKLYQLNPVSAAYARYSPKATFHDPIGLAEGLDAVKAQFNSMPKIFSSSETQGVKFLDNPAVKPPSVQFSLSQNYHFKFPPTSKLVNSLITLTVDPSSNLITHHEEEWDGKNNSTSEDGFFGKINEMRKKLTAEAVKAGADTRPIDQQT